MVGAAVCARVLSSSIEEREGFSLDSFCRRHADNGFFAYALARLSITGRDEFDRFQRVVKIAIRSSLRLHLFECIPKKLDLPARREIEFVVQRL